MEQVLVAIIGGIVAVIVAIIGVWSKVRQQPDSTGSKSSSSVINSKLIETLNSTVEAQTKQIDILRGIVDEQRLELREREREIEDLRERVSNLERLTVQQALLIGDLEKAKGRIRPWPKSTEGGEDIEHD